MSTLDVLQPFVGKNDIREYLRAPWRDAGFIYASNGRWIVRIPDDGREVAERGPSHPKAAQLFAKFVRDGSQFTACPVVPSAKLAGHICTICKGRGKVRVSDCDDCDGKGYFLHGRHEYDCRECNESGKLANESAEPTDCQSCDGTGERSDVGVEFNSAFIGAHYARHIATLPGVTVSTLSDPAQAVVFKFDGGEGLLMQRRKD
jgi:hypothetical protein